MPLEDLIELGYAVNAIENVRVVSGFDKQWTHFPGDDEAEIVRQATNHKKLYEKMTTAQTYFAENYANWPTMTAQQKDAANRQAQRALTNLIRSVRNDLSSEGI